MKKNKKKNIFILSLKYAPGLLKEFFVLGNNIRKQNANVRYMLSEKYKALTKENKDIDYVSNAANNLEMILETFSGSLLKTILEIFNETAPDVILFYNPHLLNPILSKKLKKIYPDAKIMLYLHDPYKPEKKSYGIKKSLYYTFVERVQKKTVKYMDHVISPSQRSSELFLRYYKNFSGKNHIAPLILPDKKEKKTKPLYFTIVGHAHFASGHDDFFRLIKFTVNNKLSFHYAIISSSNIDRYMNSLTKEEKSFLKVINKPVITDDEIDDLVSESFAVFRFDKEVTQSGVIPVAYRKGVPVIVRNIPGLGQHVDHKKSGYVISEKFSVNEAIEAMKFVKENFNMLTKKSKDKFNGIWSEKNWINYYSWLKKIIL
ncbi:MAG: hypothetical protein OEZ13_07305 [Spirochaetia bacterium]|nr:hypothetical protein [Spirochaetia bacterium]